jgi:hypothetical protein
MGLSILISMIEPSANSYPCSQFGQAQGVGTRLKAPLGHLLLRHNDLMTAARPNDGRSPNDGEAK